MEDLLARVWDNLVGRIGGPLTFRLVIQPLVAAFLAIRAGVKDAHEGHPAYGWAIVTGPGRRRELLQLGWKDVGKVFLAAVVIDVVYQIIVARWMYPGEALIVATALAIVPYLLIRGLANRVARYFMPARRGSL